jgi:hypothetical protein
MLPELPKVTQLNVASQHEYTSSFVDYYTVDTELFNETVP